MSEPAAEQVTGTKMTNVHVEIGPGLKLGKKTDLQALIAGSGRHVNPVVLEDMYSVDADGDGELSKLEVYNLLDKHVSQKLAIAFRNKILSALSVVVLLLISTTGALAFVAADQAKQLGDAGDNEFHAKGKLDKVLNAGTSVRNFKLADIPLLSFDYLEQVEKITVLFDKRIHHFTVSSFEWIGKNEMWVHVVNDKYLLKVKDGSVVVEEMPTPGATPISHLAYAPDYAVDPTSPKTQWDSWYTVVLQRMPQTCADQFSNAFNTPTAGNPQISLVPKPEISRMCFEAHALADPINRGGALETKVANQDHGLQDWELATIEAADGAAATAAGSKDHLAAGAFKFENIDDLRANLENYNKNLAALGFV